jgi:hypothetical protein
MGCSKLIRRQSAAVSTTVCSSPNSWVGYTALAIDLVFSRSQHCACTDLWKDYWDMGGMTAQAPPTWLEDLATADISWIFDATGLI